MGRPRTRRALKILCCRECIGKKQKVHGWTAAVLGAFGSSQQLSRFTSDYP